MNDRLCYAAVHWYLAWRREANEGSKWPAACSKTASQECPLAAAASRLCTAAICNILTPQCQATNASGPSTIQWLSVRGSVSLAEAPEAPKFAVLRGGTAATVWLGRVPNDLDLNLHHPLFSRRSAFLVAAVTFISACLKCQSSRRRRNKMPQNSFHGHKTPANLLDSSGRRRSMHYLFETSECLGEY
ncbi:hypothetical protein K432DRAFT_145099 [Lepidopterella palustris CBS 459.81]|uniref:Uncharacterized protein n=1 Tax=Lepidopterella palustris CBS 459.81 TaxID=1314670 RepID=A0A8E2JIY4_9PEZI|nr:hypothetical protein K432DRAFT_145099 [Lepidopterella palustris CBS 459.81]